MNKFVSKFTQYCILPFLSSPPAHPSHRLSQAYCPRGTLVEEVIPSIRTVHAFGTQKILASLYNIHIRGAHVLNAIAE